MDLETLTTVFFALVLLVLFFRGFRATWIMYRIYTSDGVRSPILRQFVVGSAVKVGAAAWFAFVTARALLDVHLADQILFAMRMTSLVIAAVVLDLPSRYLKTVNRIMNGELDTRIAENGHE